MYIIILTLLIIIIATACGLLFGVWRKYEDFISFPLQPNEILKLCLVGSIIDILLLVLLWRELY